MNAHEQQEMFTGTNSTIFAKLATRWPAIKWIKKLLEPDPSIDKWMIEILRGFVNSKEICCSRCEWTMIHIIRASGEKKLTAVVDELIEIYNRHHKEWDWILVDATLIALEEMGAAAFDSIFKAFANAKDDDIKITYLGILSSSGVQDEKLKNALLEHYHLDPSYLAGSLAGYGDKSLLPFLYEQMKAIIPILKKQIPTRRAESKELDLYIELRAAIIDLERGEVVKHVPFSLIDYYRRKGKPVRADDSVIDKEYALYDYEKVAKEYDRRFLGDEVELFCDDDDVIDPHTQVTYKRDIPKIGRNDPCPCGSGKKFKKCCLSKLH